MRLIDADALYDKIEERYESTTQGMRRVGLRQALFDICNAPTIDPVKHGKWLEQTSVYPPGQYKCSVCGVGNNVNPEAKPSCFQYCWYCGAKMDLE